MPTKLQLKLVSNSGELLNVVTCHAGKISVLRATSPSELRPYQRALSGSNAKENLEITCDGAQYHPDQHTLIGFGEPAPTQGLSVKEFLIKEGVAELAVESLLLSVGLESISSKRCSDLTPDQEARLRLSAATTNADKVLVLNDPFQNIASQWRERAAEMLANYARTRKALIVIPALSYRPECWIDNECIERIEVGQTSQRTIGFGSAGSQSNAMINDLRDKLRADPRFAQGAENPQSTRVAAAASVLAAGLSATDVSDGAPIVRKSPFQSILKLGSVLAGVAAGGWLAVSFSHLGPTHSKLPKTDTQIAAVQKPPPSVSSATQAPQGASVEAPPAAPQAQKPESVQPAKLANPPAKPQLAYLLDAYPASIKASLLDTAKGIHPIPPANNNDSQSTSAAKSDNNSGNIFSLLAKAGSNKPDGDSGAGAPSQIDEPASAGDETVDMAEEEKRREEIRNRFLEAIRASAARRQEAMDEDDSGGE